MYINDIHDKDILSFYIYIILLSKQKKQLLTNTTHIAINNSTVQNVTFPRLICIFRLVLRISYLAL